MARDQEISSVRSSEIKPQDDNDKKCAPALEFGDGSCMPVEVMAKLAVAYNEAVDEKKVRGEPIKLHQRMEVLNPNKYKRYLVREFQNRLENVCDNQQCWVKQDFTKRIGKEMKQYLTKYTFRASGPNRSNGQGQFKWLNTFNIQDAMKQYEHKYKDFRFLGAVPKDFQKLNLEISNVNFDELKANGVTKIGAIFNLDDSRNSGSHWTSSFIDIDKGIISYSDSYGFSPEKEFRDFLRKAAKYCKQNGIEPEIKYNKRRHQRGSSECGVFSMNFIIRMLGGESFEDIHKKRINDSEVNRCREVYFR